MFNQPTQSQSSDQRRRRASSSSSSSSSSLCQTSCFHPPQLKRSYFRSFSSSSASPSAAALCQTRSDFMCAGEALHPDGSRSLGTLFVRLCVVVLTERAPPAPRQQMSACTASWQPAQVADERVRCQTPAVGSRWSVTFREGAEEPDLLLLEVKL